MAVVLITGCNSGFGYAAALSFARKQHTVFATVRHLAKATALIAAAERDSLDIRVRVLDVSQSDTFDALLTNIISEAKRIDILVNNAGILHAGAAEDLSEAQLRDIMEVNFVAPMLLTRAVLPTMRDQGSGLIIMMSSLSGVAGLAGDVFYSASKFAIEGATEALKHEVDRWGIRVALIECAQYATDIFSHALAGANGLPADYPENSPYRPLVENRLQSIADGMPTSNDPQIVADLMLTIAESNSSRLRWQADAVAEQVVGTVFAQTDSERDAFLRGAAGTDWWSDGLAAPPNTHTDSD